MKNYSRRSFVKRSALISSSSLFIPNFLKSFETFNLKHKREQKLVVIQLSGGNDGLNTVVPYENDIYYNARPTLAIPKSKVVRLSDTLGFHPALDKLKPLFDEGLMTVINSVGYPNPDRSHFRSMDIWQTGSGADETWETGWLGRYLDSYCQGCQKAMHGIEVDDTLSLAMKGEQIKGLAMKSPKKLKKILSKEHFKRLAEGPQEEVKPNLHYLYKTLAETVSSTDYIYNTSQVYRSKMDYPQNPFARQLKTVAELIISGLETKVYYVSLSGFDTHVRQPQQHERLLQGYASGVRSFVEDLKQQGKLGEVLIMTFSEFGRRVKQNASEGTDHGTANNLFLMGGQLKQAGFYNQDPDLSRLDEGDLIHEVDFRNVYATVLSKWLEADDGKVLKKGFQQMHFI